MKFCHYWFDELGIIEAGIWPCCNKNSSLQNYKIPLYKYENKDKTFNIEDYTSYILHIMHDVQKEDSEYCRGCIYLQDIDVDINDFIPEFQFKLLRIAIPDSKCNCRCSYCDLYKKKSIDYDYKFIPELLQHPSGKDINSIRWVAGECTLQKGFKEYCQMLLSANVYQQFYTTAIKYSRCISDALKAKQGSILVSIDAGTRETYKKIKGVDKFEAVVSNIYRYGRESQNKSCCATKFIIDSKNSNINDITLFIMHSIALGSSKCYYSFNFHSELGKSNPAISEEQNIFIDSAAFYIALSHELGITHAPYHIMTLRFLDLINEVDMQVLAREQGYVSFPQLAYSLVAERFSTIERWLPEKCADGFSRDSCGNRIIADINSRESFEAFLASADTLDASTNICFLPDSRRLDCDMQEYLIRVARIRYRDMLDAAILPAFIKEHPLRSQQLEVLAKQGAGASRWLAGKDVLYYGAGAAYEQYKAQFADCNPVGILLDNRYAESHSSIDGIPVFSFESLPECYKKIPVIVFSREQYMFSMVYKIRNQLQIVEEYIVRCVLNE